MSTRVGSDSISFPAVSPLICGCSVQYIPRTWVSKNYIKPKSVLNCISDVENAQFELLNPMLSGSVLGSCSSRK